MIPSIQVKASDRFPFLGLYSSCSCLLLILLYWYLMNRFVASPPIFDEIWKLDVATSPSPIDRIASLHTPLAPGWAYLSKSILWFCPPAFQVVVARCFAAFWILPVIVLAPRCLPKHENRQFESIFILAGAVFLGLAQPVQSALTYFNPYLFEIAYAVALLVIAGRWRELGFHVKCGCLALLCFTPLFTFSAMFFLPGIYMVLFWQEAEGRWRIALAASAIGALVLAALLTSCVYGAMKSSNLGALESFWDPILIRRNPVALIKAIGRFPGELASSLLPLRLMPVYGDAVVHGLLITVCGLILLGFKVLWRIAPCYVGLALSASLVALVAAFVKPWPLSFVTPLNRINLAWLWPWYFAFGVGAARAIVGCLPGFMRRSASVYIATIVVLWPLIDPYPVPDDSSRAIFADIENTIYPSGRGRIVVFPFHYSTVPYANFILANRWPSRYTVIEIDQKMSANEYLKSIPVSPAIRDEVEQVWLIIPHFLTRDPLMHEIDDMQLAGFRLDQVTEFDSSQIRRYQIVR